MNIGYHHAFFADGGIPTLELQVIAPIENPVEMDLPIDSAIERLTKDALYIELFEEAYERKPDLFSLIRAIACYERSLLSGNSSYDLYQQGKMQLTDSELKGMQLFFSDSLNCSKCHEGFNFTHFSFENNGLYKEYKDQGRQRVTVRPQDEGKFKVPTLRNIQLTAPYMHDGSLSTLDTVIDHYAQGGKHHKNQSELIQGFTLSTQNKTDLINFLNTLTDTEL
jgi:cytochrome c peroxidase